MFCENCGNKIEKDHKFCIKCGYATSPIYTDAKIETKNIIKNDRWWYRLLKVIYVFLYLQILWVIPVVWSSYSSSYNYYSGYEDTQGSAFWHSILAIIIFVTVLRLIKLSVTYIILGQKPIWHEEIKKLF